MGKIYRKVVFLQKCEKSKMIVYRVVTDITRVVRSTILARMVTGGRLRPMRVLLGFGI